MTFTYNNELPSDHSLFEKTLGLRAITLDAVSNHRHLRVTYLLKPDSRLIISSLLQAAGLENSSGLAAQLLLFFKQIFGGAGEQLGLVKQALALIKHHH